MDIEGYALSQTSTVSPYPTRMFLITNLTTSKMNFMFISHRSNSDVDNKGGMLIAYIDD